MNNKILVIDDDTAIRKSFALTLNDIGFQVDQASSGNQGIENIKNKTYDLIFLDLKMPGLNGCETLSRIRQINTDVPVYIITAFHQEYFADLQQLDSENIAYELLKKPIDSNNLIALVNSMLIGPQVLE
ncbi:MAG: Sporulation initiation phosphotransferase F [Candidatus Magnetoglobus multicellularis str. Araruama]|uniref:Sporulation initiation phosphotransferase F n=1 Tax=Candidatus Magnetoglobus multicellularis str. Araruama TaxID=890399 RepID=A0A1V1PCF7_9BACT|nr:MAG: Sporulation initiation phosphotransferase F [Candidatus Magnetoglobus multicellularis str. Araruama]